MDQFRRVVIDGKEAVELPLYGKHGQGKVALIDHEDLAKVLEISDQWGVNHGYVRVQKYRVEYFLHRVIMDLVPSVKEDPRFVDHVNHNPLDNRKANLRVVTHHENNMNRSKNRSQSGRATSSIYKGVSWRNDVNKWRAYIKLNGKQFHLGLFEDEELAALAHDQAAIQLFGPYALTNFIYDFIPIRQSQPGEQTHITPEEYVSRFGTIDFGQQLKHQLNPTTFNNCTFNNCTINVYVNQTQQ